MRGGRGRPYTSLCDMRPYLPDPRPQPREQAALMPLVGERGQESVALGSQLIWTPARSQGLSEP
jgi:hypothetical protein